MQKAKDHLPSGAEVLFSISLSDKKVQARFKMTETFEEVKELLKNGKLSSVGLPFDISIKQDPAEKIPQTVRSLRLCTESIYRQGGTCYARVTVTAHDGLFSPFRSHLKDKRIVIPFDEDSTPEVVTFIDCGKITTREDKQSHMKISIPELAGLKNLGALFQLGTSRVNQWDAFSRKEVFREIKYVYFRFPSGSSEGYGEKLPCIKQITCSQIFIEADQEERQLFEFFSGCEQRDKSRIVCLATGRGFFDMAKNFSIPKVVKCFES